MREAYGRAASWSGAAVLLAHVHGCASTRDVVPESQDVHDGVAGAPKVGASAGAGGYEYIAKRPLAVVAVAESRGLAAEVVKNVTERLADSLDVCATRLAGEGRLVAAAARVAAHIGRDGTPEGLALTLTPGPGPTANALLCFVSPFKLVRFPLSELDATARGIALEASWGGPATSRPAVAPTPLPPPPQP